MRRTILTVSIFTAAALTVAAMSVRAQDPQLPRGPATADPTGATVTPSTQPTTAPSLEESQKIVAYSIGMQMGQNLKRLPFAFDIALVQQGLADGANGAAMKYDEATLMAAQTCVQQEMMKQEAEKTAAASAPNKAAGRMFMEENAKKPGVKTTASGLQYQSTQEGTGAQPAPTDTVTVHYTGRLIDGTPFDSSHNPDGTGGQPISFPLDRVIRGWTEGLQLMKIGGKAKLVIPSDLAYGDEGSPPTIPPGATLVFDVELIDVKPTASTPGAPGR